MKKEKNRKEVGKKVVNSDYLNAVSLIGRLSGEPTEKILPSGDKVVEFRVVIAREGKPSKSKKSMVDTIDVAAWSAVNRKIALKLNEHSWVAISGSIRRRFWQSPAGLASRWQVEASDISTL